MTNKIVENVLSKLLKLLTSVCGTATVHPLLSLLYVEQLPFTVKTVITDNDNETLIDGKHMDFHVKDAGEFGVMCLSSAVDRSCLRPNSELTFHYIRVYVAYTLGSLSN